MAKYVETFHDEKYEVVRTTIIAETFFEKLKCCWYCLTRPETFQFRCTLRADWYEDNVAPLEMDDE
jgi:hypothetical protein